MLTAAQMETVTLSNLIPIPDSLQNTIRRAAEEGKGMVLYQIDDTEVGLKVAAALHGKGYKVYPYSEDTILIYWYGPQPLI